MYMAVKTNWFECSEQSVHLTGFYFTSIKKLEMNVTLLSFVLPSFLSIVLLALDRVHTAKDKV